MTGSWTDDELPNTPHAEHIYGGGAPMTGERIPGATNTGTSDTERREQLRAEELERMERLAARIEQGIEEGLVDLESATTMLLNVSRARAALGGVGTYPGAF